MSQPPPPYYNSQPGYYPQTQNAYPPPTYPQGTYYPNQQPQVVYVDRRPPPNDNTCWLYSLLALCCGCFLAGDRKIWSTTGCRMSDNSEDLEEQKDATQLSQANASVGSSSVAFDEDTLKEVGELFRK
ncbi:hypothetical protein WR25_27096 [Diploscapter pachys]|uniref:Cysteine-rich transmembrane CYSTM domain-containing protein n=1 Tax=Diploscapter pachys TaxID=2018661 RepID=A0A2A2KXX5_9BILA|nr:hypothetical protein WR25_27096 [Diploscapter pachys]